MGHEAFAQTDNAIAEERRRLRDIERADELQREIERTAKIVFTLPTGERFLPLQKGGALRNGNERGAGSVHHAVMIDEGQTAAGYLGSDSEALCGTYPSVMWRAAEEGDMITCPRCLKKLASLEACLSHNS